MSEVTPSAFKKIFQKFNEFENFTTLAIKMRNSIKNATVANAVKTAVKNYVVNETSMPKTLSLYIICSTTYYISEKDICINMEVFVRFHISQYDF